MTKPEKHGDIIRIVPFGTPTKFALNHVNTGLDMRARFRTITGARRAVERIVAKWPDIGTWTTETIDGWGEGERREIKSFIMSTED